MKISLNIKLGIGAGIINCIAWYVIAKALNFYSFGVEQYRYLITIVLLIAGASISIFNERKNNSGYLLFKEGLKCGIIYTLILAVFLAIFNYLYYTFIVPDAVDYFLSEARKAMTEKKLSENDILKSLEVIKSYFGSFRMLMSTLILGIIVSLIFSASFRRKNPVMPFSEN